MPFLPQCGQVRFIFCPFLPLIGIRVLHFGQIAIFLTMLFLIFFITKYAILLVKASIIIIINGINENPDVVVLFS